MQHLAFTRAGGACRLQPTGAAHGSGSWFMWHALNGEAGSVEASNAGEWPAWDHSWGPSEATQALCLCLDALPAAAVAVPSALTLSADHRKHFLSALVMLITGQSVRAGTTDPSILHLILTMLRKWLLDPKCAHLTAKELLVIIQRIAQVKHRGLCCWRVACVSATKRVRRSRPPAPANPVLQLDRMHAIPLGLKPVWDKDFLALLYDTITRKTDDDFGSEVFNRVERTFCCGLQSEDPAVRQKVGSRGRYGRLSMQAAMVWAGSETCGSSVAPFATRGAVLSPVCRPGAPKFVRQAKIYHPGALSFVVNVVFTVTTQPRICRLCAWLQGQDWDFIAHTFWLKHGVAMLFDSLYLAEGVTLAYNSGASSALGVAAAELLLPQLNNSCCRSSSAIALWCA